MITVQWERYPLVDQHPEGRRWSQFTANIGRAWNTVDAYGRAVDDHLAFCLTIGTSPETARPDAVAAWIGDMHQRPNRNGGVELANSTIQVRIVGVRPEELGADRAFVALTAVQDSITGGRP